MALTLAMMWASALPDMWNNSMMNLVSAMIRTLPGLPQLATLCLAVTLSCAFSSASAVAQNQNQDDSAQQEAADGNEQDGEQEQSKTEKENESSSSVGRSSPNTFVPSEGISEDLSVSFPVDI